MLVLGDLTVRIGDFPLCFALIPVSCFGRFLALNIAKCEQILVHEPRQVNGSFLAICKLE